MLLMEVASLGTAEVDRSQEEVGLAGEKIAAGDSRGSGADLGRVGRWATGRRNYNGG